MASNVEGFEEALNQQTTNTQDSMSAQTSIFSLGNGGAYSGLYNGLKGNFGEYLTELKKAIELKIEEHTKNRRPGEIPPIKTIIIDSNPENGGLAYSTVVLATKTGTKIAYYFFMLTHTGEEPTTTGRIMEEFKQAITDRMNMNSRGYKPAMPFRTMDAIVDDLFHATIRNHLAEAYAINDLSSVTFESLQGTDMNPNVGQVPAENAAIAITQIALNTLIANVKMYIDKDIKDVNIASNIVSASNDYKFQLETKFNPTSSNHLVADLAGNPLRQDFMLNLVASKKNITQQSFNKPNTSINLAFAGGYLDVIPREVTIPGTPATGGMPITRNTMVPHMIITQAFGNTKTLGFSLLAIVTSTMLLRKENMMEIYKNNIGTINCPGNYNYVCNLLDAKKKDIKPINFASPEFTPEAINNMLAQMVSQDPILSIDILPYGDQSFVEATYVVASKRNGDMNARKPARHDIIMTAHQLTNGLFDKNYDPNLIFNWDAVPFPAGYYRDKNGIKDLRNIDFAAILNYSKGNEEIVRKWLTATYPEINGQLDPFLGKIDVLTSHDIALKDAIVYGRGSRITFHPLFIKTLTEAVMAAGLMPEYTPIATGTNTGLSYTQFNMYLNNAGISGINFGNAWTQPGQNFGGQFNYTSMGMGGQFR